jgi:rod shape-determining protein MreB
MLGRTPGNIVTIRPMKDGVIADFTMTEEMLKQFIKKVHKARMFRPSPRVLACRAARPRSSAARSRNRRKGRRARRLPHRGTDGRGDRRRHAGARGARLDGLDIGGGTSEVAVISLNGVVYSQSVRIGGDRFDEAIINYVRRNHGTLIGESTAEKIKLEVGCAFPQSEVREIEVSGRNLAEGVPRCSSQLQRDPRGAARTAVGHRQRGASALEQTPPELCSDVAERGIVLTGGGALLRDLDRLISEETGLHVQVADDPLTCVAGGGGRALELVDQHGSDFFATE